MSVDTAFFSGFAVFEGVVEREESFGFVFLGV
jgi:hypothetical protein